MSTRIVRKEAERKEIEKEMLLKVLMSLLKDEENRYCADCESKGPRWASWNLGVFVCIRCAGIHRKLGVHISKVKSINLDGWQAEQVQSMCVIGNSVAKAVYEDSLPAHFRRPQSDQSLESFIRAKYEHKRYIMKDWVPPKIDIKDIVIYDEIMDLRTNGIVRPVGARKTVPTATVPRPAPSTAPVAPVAAVQQAPQNELLDLDLGGGAPSQPPAQSSVNDLFDLGQPAAVTATNGSNGASIDDMFSDFVSASPAQQMPSATAAPVSPDDLSSVNMSAAPTTVDSKKTNADIMSLFGSASMGGGAQPAPQMQQYSNGAPQQQQQFNGMPQQQQFSNVNQQLAGLNFGAAPPQQHGYAMPTQNYNQQLPPPGAHPRPQFAAQQFSMKSTTPAASAQQLQQNALNSLMSNVPTAGKTTSMDLWQ